MKQTHTTSQSLEYAAILSGLSMVGNEISDTDIQIARNVHTKEQKNRFSFASVLTVPKRSA